MSTEISPDERAPDRVSAIASVLQDNILTGHYAPGDRLPSEADLCAHFKVSRPTLREALGRLTARGLIMSRRGAGGGAFVTQPTATQASEQIATLLSLATRLENNAHRPLLTETRIQLQMGCAELAVLRKADIGDLRAEIDLQSDFSIDDAEFVASVRRMHLALAEASGNASMSVLAQSLIETEYAITPKDGYPTRVRARFLSYHVRIANGIAGGRAEDLRAALTELWGFEQNRHLEPGEDPNAQVERPPRMRDLRLPPVQRLTPIEPTEEGT
ncbi:FadR/GntR family transcriptional regulator [Pararhodobacter sp.]|uniref:FadR/GntR family transcriptional regulator n=1 Tax=Pararhodobacter sp. TaxID=2127056 RepID=UPI002AFF768C|nr:GntR family transcriptional regulator [Pararhodobacter sp.]